MKLANAACLMVLALSSATLADTPARHAIPEAEARRLQHIFTVLHGHVNNLLQMGKALGGLQDDVAHEIANDAAEATVTVGELLDLATIYQRMACAPDKAELLSWLPDALLNARKELDLDIVAIDGTLTAFANPAALSEIEAILQELREVHKALATASY